MAIKKYHVSTNLFDKYGTKTIVGSNMIYKYVISGLTPNANYTCSTNFVADTNKAASVYFNGNSSATSGVTNGAPVTSSSDANGEVYIMVRYNAASDTNPAIYNDLINGTIWIMLNSGSTALPYEPYGNTWNTIPYRKYGTETDTITTLPKTIIGDGQSASAVIKGNLSQSGTPSPTNPIYPSETGDKTANLYGKSNPNVFRGFYSDSTNTLKANENNAFVYIPIAQGIKYYVSGIKRYSTSTVIRWATTSTTPVSDVACIRTGTFAQTDIFTITAGANENYLAIFACGDSDYSAYGTVDAAITANCADLVIDNGYKIPISSGGTTTPVYLGETQSTRRIKKLVLTGQEDWGTGVFGGHNGFLTYAPQNQIGTINCICSHYKVEYANTNYTLYFIAQPANGRFIIFDDRFSSSDDFKTYIAQQYAAGTPVTIWYVTNTPTTGTVNEPIRKIGNYSDSVTGTGIPTTGTAETFDVDTTLKPSEVQLTYHGWHEHSDTVFSE